MAREISFIRNAVVFFGKEIFRKRQKKVCVQFTLNAIHFVRPFSNLVSGKSHGRLWRSTSKGYRTLDILAYLYLLSQGAKDLAREITFPL